MLSTWFAKGCLTEGNHKSDIIGGFDNRKHASSGLLSFCVHFDISVTYNLGLHALITIVFFEILRPRAKMVPLKSVAVI